MPRGSLAGANGALRELGCAIEAGPMHFAEDAVEIHRMSRPDPETGDLLSADLRTVTPELEPTWQTPARVRCEHGEVSVVSRAGLAPMKRLRGSRQDLDDIRELEAEDGEG